MSNKTKKPYNPLKDDHRKLWEDLEIPDNLWEALNLGGMYSDLFGRIDNPELKKDIEKYAKQYADDLQPVYTKLLNMVKNQDFRDDLFLELIKRSAADVKRWKPKNKSPDIKTEVKKAKSKPESDSER